MLGGFKLGRIFGITIRIDWSWLFIFLLIAWDLATVFAQVHPGWTTWLAWLIGVTAALLFFGSVLAHELAHSLVARARGVPVRSITLFLFGGVSNIQREPPSPLAEFLITIVGPITSIVLGFVFIWLSGVAIGPLDAVVASPFSLVGRLDPVTTLLLWLGPINILVGLFNLIPGFPLDGGRILRSILWAVTHNLRRATHWAALIGQGVAWLMILVGVAMIFGVRIPFFGTGFINGIWLIFIGWFLNSAAAQSYRQVVIEDILVGVPVAQLMRMNPPSVPATISIGDLVQNYIMGTDDQSFPVMEGTQLVGIVTLEDVRKVAHQAWAMTTVGQIMTTADKLTEVTPDEDAAEALRELTQRDASQLPVVRNGQMIGMLRRRDIARWVQLHSGPSLG
jgi:Zn-dependent protease/predicted transcriptional regulator